MFGRFIGSERVPKTNLQNSGMNSLDNELDSIPEICLSDDKRAICKNMCNLSNKVHNKKSCTTDVLMSQNNNVLHKMVSHLSK